jgi:predicted nucleic acid-binding protein
MNSVLIDTNILIYAYDQNAPGKQRCAIEVLQRVRAAQTGVVTAQVLSEFYTVATRKLAPPLTPAQAEAQLRAFSMQWPVLPITEAVVFLAARGAQEHHMHFWDAQIWAAARLHGITLIYSEDFNSGAVIAGVRFVNPLEEDA